MSVKKEASGRRSVQVEIEVTGTPEEVWQAIATGPGISSWFMPTQFEERDGKTVAVKVSFGPGMEAEAWETLITALGVKDLTVDKSWTTPAGVPPLSGVLEYVTESPYDALLRLDKPVPGIAALGAVIYPGGLSMVAMNFYLYGDQAAETVARETPLWQAWIEERFPMPTEPNKSQ